MKLKVIGWTHYDNFDFAEGDNSWAVRMAIVDEIKTKGYLFSGWDHQESSYCAPVFNDGKMRRFSQRGFADIMAEAHGHTGYMDYATYMFEVNEGACIKPQKCIFPTDAVTQENLAETFTLEVDKQFFNNVPVKQVLDVFGHIATKNAIQLPDLPELRYIATGDTLVLTCQNQRASFLILDVDRDRNLTFDQRVELMAKMSYDKDEQVRTQARNEWEQLPIVITLTV